MVAHILQFPIKEPPHGGNGALDIVRDYLERVHAARVMARAILEDLEGLDALPDGDHFLAWLWEQGFKIVPVEDDDLGD
jgi:hypothetical protein